MKMKPTFLSAAALLAAVPVLALEWQPFGARAMGMGGTGVALAQGPVGDYWNPAGLAQEENPSGYQATVGAQAAVTGSAIAGMKDLNDAYQNYNNGYFGAFQAASDINAALDELSQPGTGALLDVQASPLNLKIKGFTLFVNDLGYAGVSPSVDRVDTSLDKNSPRYIGNNTSGGVAAGLDVIEAGIGYGHRFFVPGLYVGANLKALGGITAYDQAEAVQSTNFSFSKGQNTAQSLQPGVDLGVLWDINKTFEWMPLRPRLGVTGRNLNGPKFSQPTAAKYQNVCQPGQPDTNCVLITQPDKLDLGRQARVGIALSPFHWWNITADADLTKNPTLVNGYKSQMVGAGTEINIFNRPWLNIPLRVGVAKNIGQSGSPGLVTAGFGLNFLHVILDVGAEMTPKMESIQNQGNSQKFPSQVGVVASLAVMFGGDKKEASKADNSAQPSNAPAAPASQTPATPTTSPTTPPPAKGKS